MPIGTSPSKRSHGIAAGNLSLYNLRVKNGCAVSNCENKCGVLVNRQKGSFSYLWDSHAYALNDDVGD